MATSPLFRKLKAIADDFTCADWETPEVLSPERYVEKVEADFEGQPGRLTAARRADAAGKWALLVRGRPTPSARTGKGHSPLQATATFTPEEVKTLSQRDIRRVLIGVIAEMELHEVLEWAQLKNSPGVPIIDPHVPSDDLCILVRRVLTAMLDHSVV